MEKTLQNKSLAWLSWLLQAFSGLLLVALLGLHWVAQHYIAAGGLRTYADVVDYLSHPVIFTLEIAFLCLVTLHALLGVRAILIDLDLRPKIARLTDLALLVIGAATIWYGVALTEQIIR